ncbi:hypothetical protein J3459_011264 [Metarhizium acridum]|nr:hypothetical protein J3459_011264 [Metarhizium acridum]
MAQEAKENPAHCRLRRSLPYPHEEGSQFNSRRRGACVVAFGIPCNTVFAPFTMLVKRKHRIRMKGTLATYFATPYLTVHACQRHGSHGSPEVVRTFASVNHERDG